eukprot:5216487-Pleurochrysis_carterae.AAC.1
MLDEERDRCVSNAGMSCVRISSRRSISVCSACPADCSALALAFTWRSGRAAAGSLCQRAGATRPHREDS